ncbi:phosphatase PAP2 family protein [bacterium]|nr:MAG: phosphatase PAP2 family protein [bacterium]
MKKTLPILIIFIILSLVASFIPHFNLDLLISEKIQSINSPIFTKVMWFISTVGNLPLMVAIVGVTCLLLYIFKLRVEAIIISLATAGSSLSGSFIKMLVDRPRPGTDLVRVSTWLSDKSYPSGHVLAFTVFFGFLLYLLFKKTKHKTGEILPAILLFLLIAAIGISRIYLGVHWASDILGGYLFGTLWLILAIRLYNSYHGKR